MKPAPRPRAIVMRLAVLVTAAAMAVFLQAGAGASPGHGPRPAPAAAETASPPACGEAHARSLLTHPAVGKAAPADAQPSAARSKSPSSGCSREASAGS